MQQNRPDRRTHFRQLKYSNLAQWYAAQQITYLHLDLRRDVHKQLADLGAGYYRNAKYTKTPLSQFCPDAETTPKNAV